MVYVASPVLVTVKVPGIVPAETVGISGALPGAAGLFATRVRQAIGPLGACGIGSSGEQEHPFCANAPATISTSRTKARTTRRKNLMAPSLLGTTWIEE